MRILITAGGTVEKIDDVRNIRNTSTGKLGQTIAHVFSSSNVTIDYIYGKDAVMPLGDVNLYPIESVRDLEKIMTSLLHQHQYDVVIHAMAVSDYEITTVTTFDDLENRLSHGNMSEVLDHYGEVLDRNSKIRSGEENLVVLMKKAPKIISLIKTIQPNTILIGFKLLVGVSVGELMAEGHKLMDRNDCDYVLANDLNGIDGENHIGYLISKSGKVEVFETKEAIANGIYERVCLL